LLRNCVAFTSFGDTPEVHGDLLRNFRPALRRERYHGNVRMGHNQHGNCCAIALYSPALVTRRKYMVTFTAISGHTFFPKQSFGKKVCT
jgi:hypothetical protein